MKPTKGSTKQFLMLLSLRKLIKSSPKANAFCLILLSCENLACLVVYLNLLTFPVSWNSSILSSSSSLDPIKFKFSFSDSNLSFGLYFWDNKAYIPVGPTTKWFMLALDVGVLTL